VGADQGRVSIPSAIRIPLVALLAAAALLLASALVAAPAAHGKSRATAKPGCVAGAAVRRPSPLRACRRAPKAPKALESVTRRRVKGSVRHQRQAFVTVMQG
jgi:hypothetical protein